VLFVGATLAGEEWPQWGGPERDFTVEARDLSRSWGDDGPPTMWERPLGGGFSSIVSDGRRLYTMYRDGDDEIVIALDPDNGKTVWEHRYSAPVVKSETLSTQYGEGPNGTPLLVDGKLVTLGFTGHVRCLDTKKGKLRWSHDLGGEFEVKIPYFGHATSPLAVGKNAVVVAGGLFAFDLDSGKVAWKNREIEGSYGSPRLVTAGGKQQIVTPLSAHLAGFDPQTGKTLWKKEHKNEWGTILTSPVVDDAGRIFISAAQAGSVLVDPAAANDDGRQVWKTEATQIAHTNAVRAGKWLFASVGDSAAFMTATSLEDGAQAWKERGFARANLVRVGDDYLLLDFEGQLALVELSGEGMQVVTQASINDEKTWTPPTLLGTTLYVRDESRMVALDLSVGKTR
jgi:outer membrane protein assembly factor BamB